MEKQREREEKRKEKHLKKIQEKGQIEISQKIRVEERKLMIAQRKLESIRILEKLFDRIKVREKKDDSLKLWLNFYIPFSLNIWLNNIVLPHHVNINWICNVMLCVNVWWKNIK